MKKYREKIKILKEFLYEKFAENRDKYAKISDILLKKWALIKAKNINFPEFKCSINFLDKFKKDYSISNRKAQKLIVNNQIDDSECNETVENFRKNFIENYYHNYSYKFILNSDQTISNMRMHRKEH